MIVSSPILAPCRTPRRVAGGVLLVRGRSGVEINHGCTRTTFANAHFDSGFAGRRCACGEAVRLPEAEGRAEKRSQEAARGASVLVCGSLQRFERAGVEERVEKADVTDAAVVVGSGLERVVRYHHLFDSLVKTNMKMSIAGAAPIHYQGWQHSKQIGVCPSIGEREDEFAGGGVEIEQHPVVFDVAVAKSVKVAGERVVLVLRREGFAHGEHADNGGNLLDVFASLEHLLEALSVAGGFADSIFHDSRNSSILSGSVQVGALGSLATAFASL